MSANIIQVLLPTIWNLFIVSCMYFGHQKLNISRTCKMNMSIQNENCQHKNVAYEPVRGQTCHVKPYILSKHSLYFNNYMHLWNIARDHPCTRSYYVIILPLHSPKHNVN
eukprot:1044053_1